MASEASPSVYWERGTPVQYSELSSVSSMLPTMGISSAEMPLYIWAIRSSKEPARAESPLAAALEAGAEGAGAEEAGAGALEAGA